jgi:hypothetical protein
MLDGRGGLELSPERLTDLRQDAGVPCKAKDRRQDSGRREEADHQGRARAGCPRRCGRDLRRQRQARGPRRLASRPASPERAAGAPARADGQPASAYSQTRAHPARGLRGGDLPEGARLGSSEGGSAPIPKPPPEAIAPAKPALEAEHSARECMGITRTDSRLVSASAVYWRARAAGWRPGCAAMHRAAGRHGTNLVTTHR